MKMLTRLICGLCLFSLQNLLAQPGALDLTFNTTGKIQEDFNGSFDQGNALAIQSDGKIVAVGSSYDGSTTNFALARYWNNGTLDNSFGTSGKKVSVIANYANGATDVAIQPDGKIVVVGYLGTVSGSNNFGVARYLTNGDLDYTFGTNGVVSTDLNSYNDVARSVVIQPDGKILVGGYTQLVANGAYNFGIVRYTSSGSLDASFGSNGKQTINYAGQGDFLRKLLLLPNGNFVGAGYFTSSNMKHIGLIGFKPNGALNTNFGSNGKLDLDFRALYNSEATDIAWQADSKIIVAGVVENAINPYYDFAAVRIDTTGALDMSFANNGKYNIDLGNESRSFSVVIQSDGKIVLGGRTINSATLADFRIIRLNANGSLNTTFGNNGSVVTSFNGQQNEFNKMKIGADGKIVAIGSVGPNANDIGLARYETGILSAPSLLSPTKNSTNVSLAPVLDWSDVATATNYSIQVSIDSNFGSWVVNQNTTTSTISIASLVAGQKYFWRARAFLTSDTSAWSAVWSFTTLQAPPIVTLISPTNSATNVSLTPAFSWNSTLLATQYELQVSTVSTFATTVISQPTLSISNYTAITSLNTNTKYYWRVRAKNIAGNGVWSAIWSFITQQASPPIPAVPTLLVPVNNATSVLLTPAFDWNDAANASAYELQVSTTNTFASNVISQTSLTTSNYTAATALANSTVYYWRVRSKNTSGYSGWSVIWSFATTSVNPSFPSTPTLLWPADGATNISTTPTFDWADAMATNTYHIQVSTDNTFATCMVNDSTTTLSSFTPSVACDINTTYFWRVRAKGTGGISVWSEIWKFKTEVPNGIEEHNSGALNIYPNPFSDFIEVKPENEPISVTLINLQGREVFQESFSTATKITTQELPVGMYILKLQVGESIISKQIIKIR